MELKTEADGRMFPVTDSSLSVIDCLMDEARRLGGAPSSGSQLCCVQGARRASGA